MEKLKRYDLNCNIFNVYDYDGLSMQELLCQFFTKINECVDFSNSTLDLCDWLVNEGLKEEVALKLSNWLNDGTLENIINVSLFENLNKKIDSVGSQIEEKVSNNLFYNIKTNRFRYNDETDYYITEIPFNIKPKIGVAKGGINCVQSTLEFARDKRASICINAGIFSTSTNIPAGSLIINGEVLKNEIYSNSVSAEILAIDDEGRLTSFNSNSNNATTLLSKGYKNCVQGWYPFIKDGVYMNNRDINDFQPLQVIGQKQNGDYVIFTCDGRTQYDKGMSLKQASDILLPLGVVFAYNLDGGGSASTVNKFIKENKNVDNMVDDRAVSTFIYFGEENEENNVFDSFEEISKLKQELNKKIIELKNIESGFLRLKGKSGFNFPGIEFFQNGDTTRLGKVEMSKQNNFKVSYTDDEGEKEILRAKLDGLYDINGKLADFHRAPTLITDCDTVRGSGIFRTNKSTLNTPINLSIGFLINLDYDGDESANIVQIFVGRDTQCMCYREIYASGSPSNWINYTNHYTSIRPNSDKIIKGFTMFDSNINKLIIYKGDGVWVDCNGTQV